MHRAGRTQVRLKAFVSSANILLRPSSAVEQQAAVRPSNIMPFHRDPVWMPLPIRFIFENADAKQFPEIVQTPCP